jgi:uncharacterized protein YjiS (DUF1127 family)
MFAILLKPMRLLSARIASWRKRERALAELYSLDEASLADLGITRSDIPYMLCRPATIRRQSRLPRPKRIVACGTNYD